MAVFANPDRMKQLEQHPDANWVEGSSGMKCLTVPADAVNLRLDPLRHPTDPSYVVPARVLVLPEVGVDKPPYEE